MTIDIVFDFKIENNSFPIKVTLEKDFPVSKPKFFSVNAIDHPTVNKSTQEIDISKYYSWDKEKSKLGDLANVTIKHFTQNNPFTK
jgi:ubiquitin-protein ligase